MARFLAVIRLVQGRVEGVWPVILGPGFHVKDFVCSERGYGDQTSWFPAIIAAV